MAVRIFFQIAAIWILWSPVFGSIIDWDNNPIYEEEKVIMDVDAGSDDATAILLLLGKLSVKKGINVMAITCVNGNTDLENVIVNVLKTLKTVNRLDIPVYRGAAGALLDNRTTDNFFGPDGFGNFFYLDPPKPEDYVQKEHAVSALIRMVSQHPGEISLLALGPLTNIALAVRLYPRFLNDLKRIVVLGGSVQGVGNIKPGVEFNFYIDPKAAEIVLSAAPPSKPVCLVPWETVKITSPISMDWRRNVLGVIDSPAIKLLNKAERISARDDEQWINADGLAALYFLRRDSSSLGHTKTFCGGNPYYAYVLIACGDASGALLVDYANNLNRQSNIEIIEKISPAVFKETAVKTLS